MPAANNPTIIALDVGSRRIGVAIASHAARLARPYKTLIQSDSLLAELNKILTDEEVSDIVVGLPRDMQGNHTAQTEAVEEFVEQMKQQINLPIHFQDEAVTSVQAEAELKSRGKMYQPGDIDALAATYILEDYLKLERQPL